MGIDAHEMKHYLNRLRRHKRILAAMRVLGWLLGWGLAYFFMGAIIVGFATIGWVLLTGQAPTSLFQVVGLLLLMLVPVGAAELLRPRKPR